MTKRVGNAPVRNRIRRRLREAIRLHGALHARAGTDYVLVGREEALGLPFEALLKDMAGAFRQVHARLDGTERSDRPGPHGKARPPGRPAGGVTGTHSDLARPDTGDGSTGRTE